MEPSVTEQGEASTSSHGAGQDQASVTRIQQLLKSKDDTSRFVGLALLKSVLDNSPQLREDEEVIRTLWSSLSAKFLDRLLRTGSKASRTDSKEMLDLAVSILRTFALLLPEGARGEPKFTERIPGLVTAALYSCGETTQLLLQLLFTLVSARQGALALAQVEDLSALTEMAPSHALVMDVLRHAWLNAMVAVEDKEDLARHVDSNLQSLVSSFNGTDAVTLLEFLGSFLRQVDPQVIPRDPRWLETVVGFIRNLVTKRPTAEARSAYANAAASLLQAYPLSAPRLLFKVDRSEEKPFSYLLINLLLIDIRSSAPLLLEQLNSPEYANTFRRLASSFDVVCVFIGYLVRSLEDESLDELVMSPDHLLKLRRAISETMSVTIEYLRDRWDATFAGAMGLHPDARSSAAETSSGSHRTLTWDSLAALADQDPLILSAVRALALWLREEENDMLRKEAMGLTDMLVELYQGSSSDKLDFRSPALVAMEALVTFDRGRDMLLRNNGWRTLSADLTSIMNDTPTEEDAYRGIDIVRVLLQVVEQTGTSTEDEWMDLVTSVAACDVRHPAPAMLELQVAVLQLCCALLVKATDGMRRRYIHSTSALAGIASQLKKRISRDSPLWESLEDASMTLRGFL